MTAVRSWYEDTEYRDFGDTVTRTGNTTFTIAEDVTGDYVANRPIRCEDSSTLYGYIVSSSYSAPNTTVTVTLDSGNLSASLTSVALGVSPFSKSIPIQSIRNGGTDLLASANTWTALNTFSAGVSVSGTQTNSGAINEAKGSDIASAATTDIGASAGNFVEVTGTTTITALGTVQAGTRRIVRFTGILTLTHNATSLSLPTSANITTAAGDTAEFVSNGSGNWVCVDYTRKSGASLINSSIDIQTFNSSGTWTKPAGFSSASKVLVQNCRAGGGGGGGAYAELWLTLSQLAGTETVTVGAGGAAVSADDTVGNVGGNTTFGSFLTAYGGGGGGRRTNNGFGGGGGGLTSVGIDGVTSGNGGTPLGGAAGASSNPGVASNFGGGGGGGANAQVGGYSVNGGGGGGSGQAGANGGSGGGSFMGGGGGGGGASSAGNTGVGGTSVGGGNGGQGNTTQTGNATAGSQPGGGGGGAFTGNSGAGGDGRVLVTVFGA
jgi:hypothetical protein